MATTFPMIDTIEARTITGPFKPSQVMTQTWDQFGENGIGVWLGNVRQTVCDLTSTHAVADRAAADSLIYDASTLVGELVSIQRDYGGTAVDNCAILSVEVNRSVAAAGVSGVIPGTIGWIVELSWRVLLPTTY